MPFVFMILMLFMVPMCVKQHKELDRKLTPINLEKRMKCEVVEMEEHSDKPLLRCANDTTACYGNSVLGYDCVVEHVE